MLAPGSEIGRYVIRRKLAEGGMAEIFLASAVGPEGFAKDVVIKVVRSFLAKDSQFVQMFIAEARLASRLNHANVVQIFDFGKHGDSYYLAMEYVRGASLWDLRKRCRETGVPFPPALAAEIVAQVSRGLQYAHALTENGQRIGVVHRDVTPHNVLLSFDGAVKLTDFGIAKATTSHTAPGMLKGKFAYMSPEQARGEKVDARSDLFALGVVLWELLTGGRLFDGDSDLAVLRAVQESLIPPPARLNPDVPQDLSDLVMKALARPLPERFQSAFELEKALGTWVLRNAKSIEDTSVALFLQSLFPEEAQGLSEPTPGPGQTGTDEDDVAGLGDTHPARGRREGLTKTATPVRPVPNRVTPLVGSLGKTEPLPGLNDDESTSRRTDQFTTPSARVPTEPHEAVARPKTEQMPAHRPPISRRYDPIVIDKDPSVVVSQSQTSIPSTGSTRPGDETLRMPPASDALALPVEQPATQRPLAPLVGALAGLLLVAGAGIAFVASSREEPAAPTGDLSAPRPMAEVLAEPKPAPPPADAVLPAPSEPPAPTAAESTPVAAAPAEVPLTKPTPAPPEEPKRPTAAPPVARKLGSLAVKAVPFATVTVQGKSYEVTGVKTIPAPAGTYEIRLSHPRKTLKQRVTVEPGEATPVSFSAQE